MVSGPDVAENLAAAAELLTQAATRGARLAVLPENCALMGQRESDKLAAREAEGEGPIQTFLAEQAAQHRLWLVGGTIPLRIAGDDNRVRAACLLFDDQGLRVARYDKVHLFGFETSRERYDESATIEAGNEVVCFDGPCGEIGLSICYDLRFPELFRAMGEVSLIVLPAAFTHTTGRAHWQVLLRARAIENQCYVLASAQGGTHPHGRRTWGESIIIDPWGEVLASLPEGPGVVVADVDPARIAGVRASLPALRHRKIK